MMHPYFGKQSGSTYINMLGTLVMDQAMLLT